LEPVKEPLLVIPVSRLHGEEEDVLLVRVEFELLNVVEQMRGPWRGVLRRISLLTCLIRGQEAGGQEGGSTKV